jgi:CheY-like chemotaxis protein
MAMRRLGKFGTVSAALCHIPIVALTAHAMKGDDIKCKEAGMDDHLTKPLDRQRLQSRLEYFLGAERDAAAG